MRGFLPVVAAAVLAGLAALLLREGGEAPGPGDPPATASPAALLGAADTAGFARARPPAEIRFPRDHGPHPEYRNEWWYFVANLEGAGGREVGAQLVFFRTALAPEGAGARRRSAWATRQAWMAHFALADPAVGRFRSTERFARGALGLAGARADPFRVRVEGWEAREAEISRPPGSPPGIPALRLAAGAGKDSLDLLLRPVKPPVLHGDSGLSRKSASGAASLYYSVTRFRASGRVRSGDDTLRVRGTGWLDREWSTSALAPDQAGWDWFGLHLEDGRDVMLYRLRAEDGTIDPASGGAVVSSEGGRTSLSRDDFDARPTRWWRSPETGVRYPVRWRIELPGEGLVLRTSPYLEGQELDATVRYWEGAVRISGEGPSGPVEGRGYVELTGYGG